MKFVSVIKPVIDKEKRGKAFEGIIELRNKLNKDLHGTKFIRKWRDLKHIYASSSEKGQ